LSTPPNAAHPPVGKPDEEARETLRVLREEMERTIQRESAAADAMERKAKAARDRIRQRRKLIRAAARHHKRVQTLAQQMGLDPARPVTPIPPLAEGADEMEFQTIEEDLVHVRVSKDRTTGLHHYEVIEPPLTAAERQAYGFIRDTLVRTVEPRPTEDRVAREAHLQESVERIVVDYDILVDEVSRKRIAYYVLRDFLGHHQIDAIMKDPLIEDISCDGPGIPIYIFHREFQSMRSNRMFETEDELDRFVIRLAQVCGKSISIAEPLLDATLPEGSRLNATLSREVTTRGSSFTIRKYRSDPLTPPDLIRLGTISAEMGAVLWLAMESGRNLIMAGGTASGKTTCLNAIALFIPPQKKLVSIEDTREISLPHENWVAGLTRKGFAGEATTEINMYKLLEAALRQRPEYLVVGEVRGPEAHTLFQAMATGHATYSTMHADSVASAVYRLENQPIGVPRIMLQNLDAILVQGQVRVGERMARRVKELVEIKGIDAETGDLLTNTVFRWDRATDTHEFTGRSEMLELIAQLRNLSMEQMEQEWTNRTRVLRWMADKGVRHYRDVWQVITAYYSQPQTVLAMIDGNRDATEGRKP
jgi:archaeal flagellar protein FlaI